MAWTHVLTSEGAVDDVVGGVYVSCGTARHSPQPTWPPAKTHTQWDQTRNVDFTRLYHTVYNTNYCIYKALQD